MSAPEIYGLPEIPEIPSVPIFPAREVDRWPYHLPHGSRSPEDAPTEREETDRVELSGAARSFLAARVLFEDIVAGLRDRMQAIHEPIAAAPFDGAEFDAALRRHAEEAPLATSQLMIRELQRIAWATFGRVERIGTAAFEEFRDEARSAVEDASRTARERLAADGQLDSEAAERIDTLASEVAAGIAQLTPR